MYSFYAFTRRKSFEKNKGKSRENAFLKAYRQGKFFEKIVKKEKKIVKKSQKNSKKIEKKREKKW